MSSQELNISSCAKLRPIRLCGCADWFESALYTHTNLYLMMNREKRLCNAYTTMVCSRGGSRISEKGVGAAKLV